VHATRQAAKQIVHSTRLYTFQNEMLRVVPLLHSGPPRPKAGKQVAVSAAEAPTASSEPLEQRSTALPVDRVSRQSGGSSPGPLLRGLNAVRIQVKLGVSGQSLRPPWDKCAVSWQR
jgi:hypothetical protein